MRQARTRQIAVFALLLAALATAVVCAAQTSGNVQLWVEEEVRFESAGHLLYGVLCKPPCVGHVRRGVRPI
ncbi:hypothetical protein ACFLSF_01430, partial [Candidatus Bipolaricaulota bacterium]